MDKKKVCTALIILIIPITLLIGNFNLLLFEQSFYAKLFTEVGTYERVSEADTYAENIQNFFQGKAELDPAFSSKEQQHMHDVRRMVLISTLTLYGSLFLLIYFFWILVYRYHFSFQELISPIGYGSLTTIMLCVAAVVALISFSSSFSAFHQLFFSNGSWMFAQTDLLIQLFPESFFFAFFRALIVRTFSSAIFLLVLWIIILVASNYYMKTDRTKHP